MVTQTNPTPSGWGAVADRLLAEVSSLKKKLRQTEDILRGQTARLKNWARKHKTLRHTSLFMIEDGVGKLWEEFDSTAEFALFLGELGQEFGSLKAVREAALVGRAGAGDQWTRFAETIIDYEGRLAQVRQELELVVADYLPCCERLNALETGSEAGKFNAKLDAENRFLTGRIKQWGEIIVKLNQNWAFDLLRHGEVEANLRYDLKENLRHLQLQMVADGWDSPRSPYYPAYTKASEWERDMVVNRNVIPPSFATPVDPQAAEALINKYAGRRLTWSREAVARRIQMLRHRQSAERGFVGALRQRRVQSLNAFAERVRSEALSAPNSSVAAAPTLALPVPPVTSDPGNRVVLTPEFEVGPTPRESSKGKVNLGASPKAPPPEPSRRRRRGRTLTRPVIPRALTSGPGESAVRSRTPSEGSIDRLFGEGDRSPSPDVESLFKEAGFTDPSRKPRGRHLRGSSKRGARGVYRTSRNRARRGT